MGEGQAVHDALAAHAAKMNHIIAMTKRGEAPSTEDLAEERRLLEEVVVAHERLVRNLG